MPRDASRVGSKAEIVTLGPASSDELLRGRWPEMRIVRQVNIQSFEAEDWHDTLSQIGRLNYGKGRAFALGSVACTFVDAQEFGRMMIEKYPKVYRDRSKTTRLLRRYAKGFNQFVQQQANVEDQLVRIAEEPTGLDVLDEDDAVFIEGGMTDEYRPNTRKWSYGTYPIAGFDKFGNNDLGLDISSNEELMDQMSDVVMYLKHQKLNVQHINSRRRLHLSVFETFGQLGSVMLGLPAEYPSEVALDPPAALVNTQ